MACSFCQCRDKVNPISNGWFAACWQCRSVSKKSKKEPLFYNILEGKYVDAPTPRAPRALVLDLHNVCDRFEPKEMAELAAPLAAKGWHVLVLSYVGSTTNTRLGAQDYAAEMHQHLPALDAYLCFQRGEGVLPSNKGGFIAALGAAETQFLDDGEDHIASGKAAGAVAHLVTKNPHRARKFIAKTLGDLV